MNLEQLNTFPALISTQFSFNIHIFYYYMVDSVVGGSVNTVWVCPVIYDDYQTGHNKWQSG